MICTCCSIIPNDVLLRLAQDAQVPDALRQALEDTAKVGAAIRSLRNQALALTRIAVGVAPPGMALSGPTKVAVYDCNHTQTLPGSPIASPGGSADSSVKQCFTETTAVADFYKKVFNRNSIDDAGMTLLSSVHYGSNFNNAQWTGSQMLYGDGDGALFVDFTKSNDVMGHELTHGVTQHTLQLVYANESGGLNESMSDVFGTMFRQWRAKQTVATADWLIGSEIMGPQAKARGFTCLRDMANPGAAHCLAPQPFHFTKYRKGMDPHYSSGIPNFAFYKAAMAIGGKSWEKAGQIWYRAMTVGASPNMKMAAFARRTRLAAGQLYPKDKKVAKAIDDAWKQVGL